MAAPHLVFLLHAARRISPNGTKVQSWSPNIIDQIPQGNSDD
jgi:hypothetical protein